MTPRSAPFAVRRRRLLLSLGGVSMATALRAVPTPPAAASQEGTPEAGGGRTRPETDDVLAIDVLLLPDAALTGVALALNARLREDNPQGYPLDAAHAPHISVVQRFARAADFAALSAALTGALETARPLGWPLRATGVAYVVLAGQAVAFVTIERTAELARLQQAVIAAIAPFTVERGTEASFVPSPDFDPGIIDYVATFVPKVTGDNYTPHLTVGAASEAFVQRLVAEPFTPFTSEVAGVAVYQLGVFGTAAKRLWGWAPP
jgi:hypothetical protein